MLLIIGGERRNVGKTALATGIVRKFHSMRWTAVKLSPHRHGGEFGIREESQPGPSDTGRFLAAGAQRAFLITARSATPAVETVRRMSSTGNVIVESNSLAALVDADAFIFVLSPGCPELKASAKRASKRADAFVVVAPERGRIPVDKGAWMRGKPRFVVLPPDYASTAVCTFLRNRFSEAGSI